MFKAVFKGFLKGTFQGTPNTVIDFGILRDSKTVDWVCLSFPISPLFLSSWIGFPSGIIR